VMPGGPEVARSDVFFAIGQHMFTPADITEERLQVDDRPWAGWLYLEVGVSGSRGRMQETLTLSLGVTGPASLAERTQKFVHRITGSPQPRGWSFQLRTEPTVQIYYERAWFLKLADLGAGTVLDISPRLGADLGSVFVDGNAGVVARLGNFLPAALPPRINPSATGAGKILRPKGDGIGWYLFGGFEARAVARNLFLDGNSFAHSHSVAKRTLVRELSAGIALSFDRFALSYTFVHRSREFALQPEGQGYGSINLSVTF
ncbi:MAG: lipid A deacylase LpxR family protein, partial [Rhodothalassiaceae bacterium]